MITIIDYKAGNLTSVKLAFDALNEESEITDSVKRILEADRVVFPGVGAAGTAMKTLNDLKLVDVIRKVVDKGTPFLGICLGTQIIFQRSEEDGGVDGVGLIPGTVRLFKPISHFDKVPQMGWNSVKQLCRHFLFQEIDDNSEFYFVHSYYPVPSDKSYVIGETEYGGVTFSSVISKDNLVATQFHPEKSGKVGLRLLKNFCAWKKD
ncbi:MAG: imidazole glycerol phosphate synthase subunit HisH [Kiritimatiellae bacterium]|nr:imidazole glycerol phosphate synthase subunit HisH [Kiritimatiellia bacterium]MDD5520817.1 imidazole glycerol phosphate synthase subunit HisH [Kiritimatiellia bacterium]